MKFSRFEKIVIAILTVLIVSAVTCQKLSRKASGFYANKLIALSTVEKKMLPDMRGLSEKFQAYQDLYSSDQLTFVYNYKRFGGSSGINKDFHERLSKKLEKANFNYRYIVYKDWEDNTLEVTLRNREYMNQDSCMPETDNEKELRDFIDMSQSCINNACIVDVKNGKFILITPDVDYIVSVLKKYNPAKK